MRSPLFPYPSEWLNKPTKPVRVPEVLLPQILEYSHQLDQRVPPQPFVLGIKPSIASIAQFDIVPKILSAMQWKSQLDFARMSQDEVFDTLCGLFELDLPHYHHGLSGLGIALGGKDL